MLSLNPQLCLGASPPPSLSCNQGHHFNRIILQWGVLGGEGGECCGEMVVDGDAPQPSIIPHTHSRTQQNLPYYLHGSGSSALISTSVTSLISHSNFSPIPKEKKHLPSRPGNVFFRFIPDLRQLKPIIGTMDNHSYT